MRSIQSVGLGSPGACLDYQAFNTTKTGDKIQDFKWKDENCRNSNQVEVKKSLKVLAEVKEILPIYKMIEKIDKEKSNQANQVKKLQDENDDLKKTISSERKKFDVFEQKIMNRMEHEISAVNKEYGEIISKLTETIEKITSANEKYQENEKFMGGRVTKLEELLNNRQYSMI